MIKIGKAAGPSEVCAEMISASKEVGVSVMVELCQCVLDGKGLKVILSDFVRFWTTN